jgi:hypothetical protein
MDLKGAGFEGMDWVYLAQVRVQWRAPVITVTSSSSSSSSSK